MAISPEARAEAELSLRQFCDEHSSDETAADRQRYNYEFETNSVVLIEQKPSFLNPNEWTGRRIAKFRYSEARKNWSLYWMESSGRWHRVLDVVAEREVRSLLKVVLADPTGVFWS